MGFLTANHLSRPWATPRSWILILGSLFFLCGATKSFGDDFVDIIQPVLQQNCIRCHGGEDINGEIDFTPYQSLEDLGRHPELIQNVLDVVSANNMPPDGEIPVEEKSRAPFLAAIKNLLQQSVSPGSDDRPLRRLNRFQYNYAVRDLFQLKVNVFPLTEKLMTRHSPYLSNAKDRMPAHVRVSSEALSPPAGLSGVRAFPKDLRAAHGFDNQANQLTLSPLLLDSFLKLSISILESPDFQEKNVGIWNEFFAPSKDGNLTDSELRNRIRTFLTDAFRMPPDGETLGRYVDYARQQMASGFDVPTSMKKVASAALSSPLFLFRRSLQSSEDMAYRLASDLSFFLWSSGPDRELLALAESGRILDPEVLEKTVNRMMADPKVERFLDSFPSQWLQLEGVLAATPDPQLQRAFSLDKARPASVQMLLEPLLLFDAAYLENLPVVDLIAPDFTYRSEFLNSWYTTDLRPEPIDLKKIEAENNRNMQRRRELEETVEQAETEIADLIDPVRERLLQERTKGQAERSVVDLEPVAAWEFEEDLKDSIGNLHLKSHGEITFDQGAVTLQQAYLLSENLPFDLKAKTLEVWLKVHNLDQNGGGAMGIQGPNGLFDTIVLGERKPRHWISGSDHFNRTDDFKDSTPESAQDELLHLVMVYEEDGTTRLYRNGIPYGGPFKKDRLTFQKNTSQVIFGLRHLPAGGNKFLDLSLDQARLYDRALTAEEVGHAARGHLHYVPQKEILETLSAAEKDQLKQWEDMRSTAEKELGDIPEPINPDEVRQQVQQNFDNQLMAKLRSQDFHRVASNDARYGGVITNAAMLSMTSGPKRTHPIARGAWIIEVVFNDPPPPPPNDVPPLKEDDATDLTIRERFAKHRDIPSCAGCHSRLDPLGFAMENFDITGRWRDHYAQGQEVDASGTLMRQYPFNDVVGFKEALVQEKQRFAVAFTEHLLRFALTRELTPYDHLTAEAIVEKTMATEIRLKDLIREVTLSRAFVGIENPE